MPAVRTSHWPSPFDMDFSSETHEEISLPALPPFLSDSSNDYFADPLCPPSRCMSTNSSASTHSQSDTGLARPRATNSAGVAPPVFGHIVSAPPRTAPGISSTDRKAIRARARDPSWIPRPRNPFIIFRCEFTAMHTAAGTEAAGNSDKTLSKRAAEAWAVLPSAGKAKYKELAKVEAETHAKLYPEYRFKPNRRPAGSSSITSAPRIDSHSSGSPSLGQHRRDKVLSLMLSTKNRSASPSPSYSSVSEQTDDHLHEGRYISTPASSLSSSQMNGNPPSFHRRSSSVPLPSPPQALFGPTSTVFSGDDMLLEAVGALTRRASCGLRKLRSGDDSSYNAWPPIVPSNGDIHSPTPSKVYGAHYEETSGSESRIESQETAFLPISETSPFTQEYSLFQSSMDLSGMQFQQGYAPSSLLDSDGPFVHQISPFDISASWPIDPTLLKNDSFSQSIQHPMSDVRGAGEERLAAFRGRGPTESPSFWTSPPPLPMPYLQRGQKANPVAPDAYQSVQPPFAFGINPTNGMNMMNAGSMNVPPEMDMSFAHDFTNHFSNNQYEQLPSNGFPGHDLSSNAQTRTRSNGLDAETLAMLGLPPGFPIQTC